MIFSQKAESDTKKISTVHRIIGGGVIGMIIGFAAGLLGIGGGKKAADSIDRYLSGIPQPKMPPVPVRRARTDWLEVPASTKMVLKRPEMPLLNIDRRRTTFQQVELS